MAERFIRTLKEQLLWVQTFDTVEALRHALLEFKKWFNKHWILLSVMAMPCQPRCAPHLHRWRRQREFCANRVQDFGGFTEGTTTTPFDMVVRNDLDRFHLVMDVADRVPLLKDRAGHIHQTMHDRLVEHREYITAHGEDMPEIRKWQG